MNSGGVLGVRLFPLGDKRLFPLHGEDVRVVQTFLDSRVLRFHVGECIRVVYFHRGRGRGIPGVEIVSSGRFRILKLGETSR